MNSNEVPCWNMKHHACQVFYIFPKDQQHIVYNAGQIIRWPSTEMAPLRLFRDKRLCLIKVAGTAIVRM